MKNKLQRSIQIIFLLLFVGLMIMGKPQLWMVIFLLGIAGSFILGRFYCGWVCAINTVMVGITSLKRKMKIKDRQIPGWLKKPVTRYIALGLFILIFIFTIKTGVKLPVLPLVILIAAILTFIYPEELWHRYLCPYGTVLAATSKPAKKGVEIDPEKCNNCGVCMWVCPGAAVKKLEASHEILTDDCLICMECIRKCPKEAIEYK